MSDQTISTSEYVRLLLAELKLDMLDAGGVDNWSGYGEALNPEGYQSYRESAAEIRKKYEAAA